MAYSTQFSSPLGTVIACATDKGVCYVGFEGQKRIEDHLREIRQEFGGELQFEKNQYLIQLEEELTEYFEGVRKVFQVKLDLIGTDFRKQVWNELLNIPYGKTRSYKEQSIAMGNPLAIRAIATSNGANKISILIPCHRVIGSDGSLTGYAGGLEKKRWLLDFERKNSNQGVQMRMEFE